MRDGLCLGRRHRVVGGGGQAGWRDSELVGH